MLENVPAEVWATGTGAAGIMAVIWRVGTAAVKALTAITEFFEQGKDELDAIQAHREAEKAHWIKEEAALGTMSQAVLN